MNLDGVASVPRQCHARALAGPHGTPRALNGLAVWGSGGTAWNVALEAGFTGQRIIKADLVHFVASIVLIGMLLTSTFKDLKGRGKGSMCSWHKLALG